MANEAVDMVNHPPHYARSNHEPIDVIEDWGLGFHLGNAVKYIARAGHKDPNKLAEDIRKAIWYAERYIKNINQGGLKKMKVINPEVTLLSGVSVGGGA